MPSIRQLEYLVALDEQRHFKRAAERCHVSQPTLSAQLAALEEKLDVQLVERQRGRIVLTDIGRQVVEIARRVLNDVDEIRDLSASHGVGLGGVVRLGMAPTVGPYLVPRIVPALHKAYPALKIYAREELPVSLPASLEDGRHDLIIAPLPMRQADIEMEPLFREPLFLAMPSDHRLAARKRIERKDLVDEEILALETGHQLHEQVEDLCHEVGARLLTDYEGTSLDTLREMVGMGMGMAFLPGLYVRAQLRDERGIRIVELGGRRINRTIGLAWRRTSARKVQFREFGDRFRDGVRRAFPDFTVLG